MEHDLHQPYDNIDIVRWYLHWLTSLRDVNQYKYTPYNIH